MQQRHWVQIKAIVGGLLLNNLSSCRWFTWLSGKQKKLQMKQFIWAEAHHSYQRTIEWLRLEIISKITQFQPLPQAELPPARSGCPQPHPTWPWYSAEHNTFGPQRFAGKRDVELHGTKNSSNPFAVPVLDVEVTSLSRENRKGGREGLAFPVSWQHCRALLANGYFLLSQAQQPRSSERCLS